MTIALSPNARFLLSQRYLLPGETPDELVQRVSFGVPEYAAIIESLEFLPNSPTLFNAGTGAGTYSGCFKFDIQDSLESIMDVARKAAFCQKWGGGVGYVLSELRPRGAPVGSTHRVALGPVGVMKILHSISQEITQGGRRNGAQMAILHVDHPDILEFIQCKDENPQALSTFNISVAITDEFMDRVLNQIASVREMQIWKAIAESAWRTGDPGLYFIDTAERANPTPYLGKLTGTNPCLARGTLVATTDGWRPVEDIVTGDTIGVVASYGRVHDVKSYSSYPVYRVKFRDGDELLATAAHQFHAARQGQKQIARYNAVSLSDLRVGDWVRISPAPMPSAYVSVDTQGLSQREFGFLCGILIGDGCYTPKNMSRNKVSIAVHGLETEWHEVLQQKIEVATGKRASIWRDANSWNLYQQRKNGLSAFVQRAQLIPGYSYEKTAPEYFLRSNRDAMAGLLDGLFSTDGNIHASGNTTMLRLASTSLALLRQVRLMLLCFSVQSSIRPANSQSRGRIQGRDVKLRPSWTLMILGDSIRKFGQDIGLSHPDKARKLHEVLRWHSLTGNLWRTRIESIEPAGTADVFDLYEPTTDTWVGGGYVSRGCAEVPLLDNEACNLGSIDLGKFVVDGVTDWKRLEAVTRTAIRYLNEVLNRNMFPDPAITAAVNRTRKIGLGVMGWADALALMGIHYDTEMAVELGRLTMENINTWALEESVFLADEKGAYEPGRIARNATRTCIAPTGTIALLAGCSSGIEPHYDIEWIRVTGDGTELTEIIPVMDRINGFRPHTAHEIAPEWHIRMQAAFQRHTDLAVSKTINMPNNAQPQDIATAYMMMWTLGCKGGTVFRDGCRASQVLNGGGRTSPMGAVGEDLPVTNGGVKGDQLGTPVAVRVGTAGAVPALLHHDTSPDSVTYPQLSETTKLVLSQVRGACACSKCGGSSLVEHQSYKLEDEGSIPSRHTKLPSFQGARACNECGGRVAFNEGCESCQTCGMSRCSL